MREDFYKVQRAWTIDVILDDRFTEGECRIAVCWVQKHLNRHTEEAFVSQSTIASEVGLKPKTAYRSYKKMEKFGYVEQVGFHDRTRRLRMVRDRPKSRDGGPGSPTSPDRDDDVGHSKAPGRTPESSDNGHPSPPNHVLEPSYPAHDRGEIDANKADVASDANDRPSEVASISQMSEWRLRQLIESWEKRLIEELRKTGAVHAVIGLRNAEKVEVAVQLELRQVSLADVAADIRSRASDRCQHTTAAKGRM